MGRDQYMLYEEKGSMVLVTELMAEDGGWTLIYGYVYCEVYYDDRNEDKIETYLE